MVRQNNGLITKYIDEYQALPHRQLMNDRGVIIFIANLKQMTSNSLKK